MYTLSMKVLEWLVNSGWLKLKIEMSYKQENLKVHWSDNVHYYSIGSH